ncbi:MAG TPA: SRPBCC family protein [Candidatus Aquilonibacter sp.]|nr:SRPBCC family protein [Candidatus Aquilonibacter sp.]
MHPEPLEAVVTVDLDATRERVFRALASDEITRWWVRPGFFDTREWSGDVRAGGTWRASGIGRGNPYTLDGEFFEVEQPRRLVHTWHLVGMPFSTTVTYDLQPTANGTRIILTHAGFPSQETCDANRIGWETSFEALRALLGS